MFDVIKSNREFLEKAGQDVSNFPSVQNRKSVDFHMRLIEEEYRELVSEIGFGGVSADTMQGHKEHIARVAKECGDLIYVTVGFMNALGLPAEEILQAICENNLKKVDPETMEKRNDGKVKKSNVKKLDLLPMIFGEPSGEDS